MSRADKWTLSAVVLFVAVVFPFRVWWDCHHPENWSPGSGNEPHVYLWAWAAGGLFIAYVTIRIVNCERKTRARKLKLAALYLRAEQLLREKRWQEAESVVDECKRLVNEKYI